MTAKFDPIDIWRLVEEEKVNGVMITGDAMGRPLVEALETEMDKRDLSSFFLIVSSAAVFSPTVKDDFFEAFPNIMMIDSVGASEVGNNGAVMISKGVFCVYCVIAHGGNFAFWGLAEFGTRPAAVHPRMEAVQTLGTFG